MFLWPLSFTVSLVCSSYSEEVILHNNCAIFETSVQPEKWEGYAHVIRITTPFATNLVDGRPKSAPVAHWSRLFICSLLCFDFVFGVTVPCRPFLRLLLFYVFSAFPLGMFGCFAVDAAT